jgi:hypothetical protein
MDCVLAGAECHRGRPLNSVVSRHRSVNATFYIADPSLIDSKVFLRFRDVEEMEGSGKGRRARGFTLSTRWGKIQFKFMPATKFPAHMKQFEAFFGHVLSNADERIHALNRLAYARLAMSCDFDIGEGSEREVARFLVKVNKRLNGLLVMPGSIIDHDGSKLWVA